MYKLGMSEKQARVINSALDVYSRLLCGQIEELGVLFMDKIMKSDINREELRNACAIMKKVIFPDLHPYAEYGIYSEEAPEKSKIAYDLFQVIRNYLAWDKQPLGGQTVDFYEPLKCAKHNLAKMEKS